MPRYPEYQIHSLDTHGYGRIIQTIDGKFYDGWGNSVTFNLFGKEVSINVEGVGEDSTDGGNVNVTNTNNTDLFQNLQNQIDNLTKIIDDQKKTIEDQSKDSVPTGTIVMWGGSVTGIPTGWTLCDGSRLSDNSNLRKQLLSQSSPFGQSNTNNDPLLPDLRERFVVGAGGNNGSVDGVGYNVGDLGGKKDNMLNISNIPEHQHYYPKQIESITTTTGKVQDGAWSQKTFISGVTANKSQFFPETLGPGDYILGYDDNHDHPDKRRSYGITDPFAPGWYEDIPYSNNWIENDPTPIENRPPYFALCYIIKL